MNNIPFALQSFDVSTIGSFHITISGAVILKQNTLQINYQLQGDDIAAVNFPQLSQTSSRKDNLWEATCFELFVTTPESPLYWEYNLSPSGDWADFRFTDYRENKANEPSISNIDIDTETNNSKQFILTSSLPLPEMLTGRQLCIGISAVIKNHQGETFYYALEHRSQKPDFHNRKSFTIRIER